MWDEKKGKWVNKDADEEDESMGVKPPPKASEIPGFSNPMPASIAPPVPNSSIPDNIPLQSSINAPAATSTPNNQSSGGPALPTANSVNKFKMQRGRGK